MSNNRNISNARSSKSELDQMRKTFKRRQLEHQRECLHHDDREYWLTPIDKMRNFRRGDHDYPKSTLCCEECGKLFDGDSFTKTQTDDAVWVIEGMLEQLKVMGKLNDEQYEDIVEMIGAVDTIRNMVTYYHELDKKQDRDNRNKKRGNGNRKTSIGVSQSMFNGAGRR